MRKLSALALLCALAFVSCNDKTEVEKSSETTVPTETTVSVAETTANPNSDPVLSELNAFAETVIYPAAKKMREDYTAYNLVGCFYDVTIEDTWDRSDDEFKTAYTEFKKTVFDAYSGVGIAHFGFYVNNINEREVMGVAFEDADGNFGTFPTYNTSGANLSDIEDALYYSVTDLISAIENGA